MKYFVLLFFGFYGFTQNPKKEIYSKIINNYQYENIIALSDSTSIGYADFDQDYLRFIQRSMPKLQIATLDSFLKNNQIKVKLDKSEFQTDKKMLFISDKESNKIFKEGDGWVEFYEKYGKTQGILTISIIGFNDDMTQGLVYRGNNSDWKNGAGYLILFRKLNEIWEIEEYFQMSIS